MNQAQIEILCQAYGKLQSISIEGHFRLKKLLSELPIKSLEALAESDVKFVNTAANSVLCDKGIRSESARFDHAAKIIAKSVSIES